MSSSDMTPSKSEIGNERKEVWTSWLDPRCHFIFIAYHLIRIAQPQHRPFQFRSIDMHTSLIQYSVRTWMSQILFPSTPQRHHSSAPIFKSVLFRSLSLYTYLIMMPMVRGKRVRNRVQMMLSHGYCIQYNLSSQWPLTTHSHILHTSHVDVGEKHLCRSMIVSHNTITERSPCMNIEQNTRMVRHTPTARSKNKYFATARDKRKDKSNKHKNKQTNKKYEWMKSSEKRWVTKRSQKKK